MPSDTARKKLKSRKMSKTGGSVGSSEWGRS